MNVLAARQRIAPALTRYGSTAVAFHWAIAALVVFLGTLGLLFDDIPKESRPFWINVHGCVGLVYSPLSSPGLCGERRTSRLICRLTSASSIAALRLRRIISSMC
jgi:cytochrome b561